MGIQYNVNSFKFQQNSVIFHNLFTAATLFQNSQSVMYLASF